MGPGQSRPGERELGIEVDRALKHLLGQGRGGTIRQSIDTPQVRSVSLLILGGTVINLLNLFRRNSSL